MHFPTETALDDLVEGFLAHTLAKERWTHAAHFGAALWLMRRRPDLRLTAAMPDLIRGYNVSVGGENTDHAGYHETITQASLRAAADFLARSPAGAPLHEITEALMASPLGDKDWPLTYWSRPVLFSVEARRAWVEPDLQALPF